MSAGDEKMERSLRELLSTGIGGFYLLSEHSISEKSFQWLLWAFINGGQGWMLGLSELQNHTQAEVMSL